MCGVWWRWVDMRAWRGAVGMHVVVPRSSPALPPLKFLRVGLYPPSGVVLHCWVGLSWVPVVGPADPILRVETPFQELILALH